MLDIAAPPPPPPPGAFGQQVGGHGIISESPPPPAPAPYLLGVAPPPSCVGMSVCADRRRAIFFGGVWDYDDGEKDFHSVFHNDMYSLNLDSKRCDMLPPVVCPLKPVR